MADKKSKKKDGEAADGEDAASGGKSKLLPAIVLSAGLLGAGYFVGGGMSSSGGSAPVAEASEAEEEADEEPHDLGMLIDLKAINVNLQDGHFLRIAVSLELSEEKATYVEGKKKKDKSWAFPSAPATDMILATFSGHSMDILATADGREEARLDLLHAIEEKYHGDVVGIYLTEFVMQ